MLYLTFKQSGDLSYRHIRFRITRRRDRSGFERVRIHSARVVNAPVGSETLWHGAANYVRAMVARPRRRSDTEQTIAQIRHALHAYTGTDWAQTGHVPDMRRARSGQASARRRGYQWRQVFATDPAPQRSVAETIHSHSFKPTPHFKLGAGEASAVAFFGVELEIDAKEDISLSPVPALAAPLFYCKEDGSLNRGTELVSHPGSQAWWREQREAVSVLLRKLTAMGWSSHNVGTCGMHIHVSREAFQGTHHLYRFLHLVYRSPRLSLAVSQRQSHALAQWATLNPEARRALKNKIGVNYTDADDGGHRYEAVNMTRNTAEVRIFRGTLRLDRFYKNLQYLWAALAFTAETPRLRSCNARNFLAWVHARKDTYPDLAAFTEAQHLQTELAVEEAA